MQDRPLRAELRNTELLAKFDDIYAKAEKMWKEQNLPKYTEHGPLHTLQLEQNLYDLTRPLRKLGRPLSDEELFVLLSATCLHDIGMQLSDDPEVRRKHAEKAFKLISQSDRSGNELGVVLEIEDEKAKLAIAKVARAHWTDHALALQPTDFINNRNFQGRLRLLGLLLAMADLLDLSPVRARYLRTIYRFYHLPPESELHQTMHDIVWGMHIEPPDAGIPNELQYRVQWANDSEIVHLMNDWVMQWFNSQWRQLQEPLFRESGGTIGWAKPWATVQFRQEQSDPILSPAAQNILMAERADQIRIDRNVFAAMFLEALKRKETALFVIPGESDGDWRGLIDWCEAYAGLHNNCRLAKVDVGVTPYLPGIIRDILDQWEHSLSGDSLDESIKDLQSFLADLHSPDLVTIVRTAEPLSDSLENFINALVLPNNLAARICMVICPRGTGPTRVGAANKLILDSTLPREEIQEHLQKRHGYGIAESSRFCDVMLSMELTPRQVYTYIEQQCSPIDW